MIKLSNILLEKEDDGYVSIGFGRFKKKGQEDKDDADVYVKSDKGQYVKTKDQSSDDKGDDSEKKEKPKVNIFDKPKDDGPNPKSKDKPLVNKDDVYTDGEIETIVDKDVDEIKAMLYGKNPLAKYMSYRDDKRIQQHLDALKDTYNLSPYEEDFHKDELFAVMSQAQQNMEMGKVKQGERFSGDRKFLPKSKDDKPFVGTKVKDGKIYSSGPQRFADDVKDMKGEYDLDGGMKIKDGKMFDVDGNEMDSDEIEDFYYQDAFDEKGINVGIDIKKENYNPSDKYLTESVDLLKREFGAPLPTLQSVMEKHQKNIKEGPDDVKVTKKQLQMLVIRENSPYHRHHLHCVIEQPNRLGFEEFTSLIWEIWNSTKFGYKYIHIEKPSSIEREDGWLSYIMKDYSKSDLSTSIDFVNSTVLNHCRL